MRGRKRKGSKKRRWDRRKPCRTRTDRRKSCAPRRGKKRRAGKTVVSKSGRKYRKTAGGRWARA